MIRDKVVPGLILSAFFPFFLGGVRLEHLVFPSVFLIVALTSIFYATPISLPLLGMSLLLFFGTVFTLLSSAVSPDTGTAAPAFTMGIRLLMPSIMLASLACYPSVRSNLVRDSSQVIVWISVPLTLLALCTVFFDMSWLLKFYVQTGEDSVWSNAIAVGRFTGLFGQPLEAGIFYSVALLALVYLASLDWGNSILRKLLLISILVGGSLSLSKNFIVLGALVALTYAASVRVLSVGAGGALFGLIVVVVSGWLLFGNGNYSNSFVDLFDEGGLLLALTAGRLGKGDTEVAQLWSHLAHSENWLTGFGLGSYLPLDNGYLEYFYQGGVLALVCYLLFILGVIVFAIVHWRDDVSKLLLSLSLFAVGSSLGGPVVSASRVNVPLLVLTAACVLYLSAKKFK
jgi:hypothetical protein